MDELWKMWRLVSPKQGVTIIGLVMLASFIMHIVIMTASDRYSGGLLG